MRKVVWQVGARANSLRSRRSTPSNLPGATVRKATLNNLGDIRRKDVKVGSKVLIRRSNEVIPEILGAYEHTGESVDIAPPENCPYCGTALVEEGANIFCPNRSCRPRVAAMLANFASKGAMDIEGFSEMTAYLFMTSWACAAAPIYTSLVKKNYIRWRVSATKRCATS